METSLHNQQSATLRPESPSGVTIHPAAMLFPMMGKEELSKLADDIAANGLLDPIVIFNGEVLDGRNRLAACEMAGVEPRFTEVSELPSLLSYVKSKNLHRRHLTVGQLASIAVEMIPLLTEEARLREISGKKLDPTGESQQGTAAAIAGESVGVHERAVYQAQAIKRADPEKYEQVKNGDVPLTRAYQEVPHAPNGTSRISKEQPYRPETEKQTRRAEAQKQRMVSALSTIASLCRGLNEELDLRVAISVCSNEDIVTWASHARDAVKHLRTFTSNLERNT